MLLGGSKMRAKHTIFIAASAVAVIGMTSGTAARAAITHDSGQTRPQANALRGPGDPSTAITFTVTSGALTLAVPASADLGSGPPGTSISSAIGPCTVIDDRALINASWAVTAAETDFASGPHTIPATDAIYDVGTVTTTGTITATGTAISLSNSPQTVLTGTGGVGNNTATWNPTVTVAVPATAIGGTYSGTLTQSVS